MGGVDKGGVKSIMSMMDKQKRWFYYGMNRDETIEHLTQKLGEATERIRELERELRSRPNVPTFIHTGSFSKGGIDK